VTAVLPAGEHTVTISPGSYGLTLHCLDCDVHGYGYPNLAAAMDDHGRIVAAHLTAAELHQADAAALAELWRANPLTAANGRLSRVALILRAAVVAEAERRYGRTQAQRWLADADSRDFAAALYVWAAEQH
jgi:hypothetical protein